MSRTTRAAESRIATTRPTIGGEPKGRLDIDVSGLPVGMEATWIRETCLGEADDDNIVSAMERGYQPATTDDLPSYKKYRLPGARGSDTEDSLIRRGGQVLMIRDRTIGDEERAHYAAQTNEAARSVARDNAAPKDGRNFQDMPGAGISTTVEKSSGRFSE